MEIHIHPPEPDFKIKIIETVNDKWVSHSWNLGLRSMVSTIIFYLLIYNLLIFTGYEDVAPYS